MFLFLERHPREESAMKLEGKVALITGGTRGIGAATALVLAERGADVALVGRHDDDEARQVAARIEKLGRRSALILADMSRPEDATRAVEETARQLGSPGVLVHSAGGPVPGSLLEISPRPGRRPSMSTCMRFSTFAERRFRPCGRRRRVPSC